MAPRSRPVGGRPASLTPDGSAALLDSYDTERRPAAHQVLRMTHLAFWGEAATGPVPALLRGTMVPLAAPAIPALTRRRRLIAEGVRVLSQLRVSYRDSPLSAEERPRRGSGPRAGDRLPDRTVTSAGRSLQLHELLAQPGVHVLLDRDAQLPGTVPLGPLVHLHHITSNPGHGLLTVRPDGHVGLRCQTADTNQLNAWLHLINAPRSASNARPT